VNGWEFDVPEHWTISQIAESRRRKLAKTVVAALAIAAIGAVGFSGALAQQDDDGAVMGGSGGSGVFGDDWPFPSGGSGIFGDDWPFPSGGSGGSGGDINVGAIKTNKNVKTKRMTTLQINQNYNT